MKRLFRAAPLLLLAACRHQEAATVTLNAQDADPALPGYWFQIIFIVLPLIAILVKLFMDLGALRESLYGVETQLRRMNSRMEQLEEKSRPTIPGKPPGGKEG